MKRVKGMVAAYLYYLTLVGMFWIKNFGTSEIVYPLIIHAYMGILVVLLGVLTLEAINLMDIPRKRMIGLAGCIYGLSYAVLFSDGVRLELPILMAAMLFSCLGFFIYYYFIMEESCK